jgi:predicted Rossmann fold nucleotide-binding protein DprA/Smf involved in DNA uptake
MSTNDREEAKKRSEMLASLRKQRHDKVEQAQNMLKDQQSVRKTITRAMQGEPKTIPQIAQSTGIPAHEVLWHMAVMKKYGQVVENGLDEDYEYYLYSLVKETNL